MSLDLCIWKEIQSNPESTTFKDVVECGPDHALYKCIGCSGFYRQCQDYKPMRYIKVNEYYLDNYKKW
jgi:hypothetical protein